MMWSNLAAGLRAQCPAIAHALSGPGANIVGKAMAAALGTDETPEAMACALKKHPELAVKLQGLELDLHQTELLRTYQLGKPLMDTSHYTYWFAAGWSLFAMFYMLGITFFNIDPSSVRFADTTLGFILGTIISTVIQFFFGSTHSAEERKKIDTFKRLNGEQHPQD